MRQKKSYPAKEQILDETQKESLIDRATAASIGFFEPENVLLESVKRVDNGTTILQFVPMSTQFFYCSGVDYAVRRASLELFFVRSLRGSTKTSALSVKRISSKPHVLQVKLPLTRFGRLLFCNDDNSRVPRDGELPSDTTNAALDVSGPAFVSCGDYLLSIHSTHMESWVPFWPPVSSGHSWIELHNCQTGELIHRYALWPDDHSDIIAHGLSNADSDVRVDFVNDWIYSQQDHLYYETCINAAQLHNLNTFVSEDHTWRSTNNCASFASDAFYEATGINIDADDEFGIESPAELGSSIYDSNGGQATPDGPASAAPAQ